jgi:putative membrane protein insertion efficiency factor
LLKKVLVLMIRVYQLAVSPWKGGASCRFYPSCSVYAIDALRKHGLFRGIILAAKRFLRCHPFNPGGYDPVPEAFCK